MGSPERDLRERGELTLLRISMSILSKILRVYERVEGYFALLAIILIILIMLMVTTDVVGRYLFGRPLKGAMELSENGLVWFTFLSAAWILKREKHVTVTLVVDRLSSRAQSFLGIVTSLIGAIVCLGIVVYGIKVVYHAFEQGSIQIYVLGLPLGPLYTIIPIGSALLVIRFMLRTHKYLRQWRMPVEKEGEELEGVV